MCSKKSSSRCQFCKSDPCVTPDFCKTFKKAQYEGKLEVAVAALGASVQNLRAPKERRATLRSG